ncbi:solute carrier family 25 member 35-like, partial [Actinia tenebrosa]|uniref:Solute carrier family 25 member 35-like n=1 Tax=Actinia tenebrosa TaxID=6105 RepID=A0A6P8IL30_ACTTE
LKTQFQSQAAHDIAVGYQHAHTGLTHAVQRIYTHHGIRGFWRGVSAGVPRNAIGTSTQLSTFDITKDFIKSGHLFRPDSWLIPALASFISSIALVVTMTPLDVVSTRLFNQSVSQSGQGILYNGILDCFRKIFYREGFSGFYKGFGPQYFRSGPQTILSLLFWEKLRKLHFDYYTVDRNQYNTES